MSLKKRFFSWLAWRYHHLFRGLLGIGLSSEVLAKLANLRFRIAEASTRFEIYTTFPGEERGGTVSEGAITYSFSNVRRGLKLYSSGLEARGRTLFDAYRLENIDFKPDDYVVDCGANYGDLWLELRHRISPENYIAVEPSPPEYSALQKNLPKARITVNKALGAVNGSMEFFQQDETGDSSLVEPPKWEKKVVVQVVTLDSLVRSLKIPEVKLLKLEAEGFEPEILLGAGEMLRKCHYVAADGGYERGISKDQTFTTISNYLAERGFEMIDIFLPWGRVLFKNKIF